MDTAFAAPGATENAFSGAFHGDAELRDWLLARLFRRAAEGRLKGFQFEWENGQGGLTAGLVSSASPEVFTSLTGMPPSFAAALEACIPEAVTEALARSLLEGVSVGADLRQIAPRFVLAMLDDSVTE
ncbi:MAG: hypothetical protein CGU28_02695 [Candidatus Dactylopiibacterium carminicum]|uniref:Uncharacterized protein n=1 Tax=Candidatus Dactylopiibacterium carminicum TaxID=857335 RepID=A0A272EXT2_9RHOO|nr:hypothetical protein [Candidatus Dactylopiibacterium carminicum]KAF7600516.1 hypothetical protein BGI27_02135 [Candidatus Dactylopiibacterium carminicum]PAS94915.1 MAG: hypothetical protein CGU29_02030 [Candidatus Dactylopiibacterium carminicum]PAS98052.1 MAG: hypothetical protein CGU28_02695 [Candidatus Dactylopiibacterium carminicum]PAT00522.1 MAG: hypothetical protein BSR46_02145 [Candidatus Dactylopiibacterium carminicum]